MRNEKREMRKKRREERMRVAGLSFLVSIFSFLASRVL